MASTLGLNSSSFETPPPFPSSLGNAVVIVVVISNFF